MRSVEVERNGIRGSRPSRYGGPGSNRGVDTSAPHFRARTSFDCTSCTEQFDDLDTMAVHLQRHMDVNGPIITVRGKKRSIECPAKCGRHFPCKFNQGVKPEFRYHIKICDGSAPLIGRITKEEPMAGGMRFHGFNCPKCGKKYKMEGKPRQKHLAKCKGSKPAPKRAPAIQPPADGSGHLQQALNTFVARLGEIIQQQKYLDTEEKVVEEKISKIKELLEVNGS